MDISIYCYSHQCLATSRSSRLLIYSNRVKVIATSATTLERRGTVPLYKAMAPSLRTVCRRQSRLFLYQLLSRPCILVLMTSTGVLASTEASPASPPANRVATTSGNTPRESRPFLASSQTRKRTAWLLPYLTMVGPSPLQMPCQPCCSTMQEMPCTSPLYLGRGESLSSMSLTLSVSAGVTTRMASVMPAPRPARKVCTLEALSVNTFCLRAELLPNLTAVLGTEKSRRADSPLQKPLRPCCRQVCLITSPMPCFWWDSNCSYVFTYSVGQVMQISMPPVRPPDRIDQRGWRCWLWLIQRIYRLQGHQSIYTPFIQHWFIEQKCLVYRLYAVL